MLRPCMNARPLNEYEAVPFFSQWKSNVTPACNAGAATRSSPNIQRGPVMRKSIVFILAAIPFALHAQQTQQTPGYGETIEVRVINVDVVVTDRAGKPVSGL